jgi:hypothetical protein
MSRFKSAQLSAIGHRHPYLTDGRGNSGTLLARLGAKRTIMLLSMAIDGYQQLSMAMSIDKTRTSDGMSRFGALLRTQSMKTMKRCFFNSNVNALHWTLESQEKYMYTYGCICICI